MKKNDSVAGTVRRTTGRGACSSGEAKRGKRKRIRSQKKAPTDPPLSEGEFRKLFDANPTPMWVYDTATLRFLEVNEAAIAQYGYSREEFLARTAREIRAVDNLDKFQGLAAPSRWRRFSRALAAFTQRRLDDFRFAYSSPLIFAGRPARMVVATDVTEQHEADEKIRQSEANLALAQRLARMGSWEFDVTSREERAHHPPRWSEETFRIFGLDPATKVGRDTFLNLLHPDERQIARETYIEQVRTGGTLPARSPHHPAGRVRAYCACAIRRGAR